MVSKIFSRQYWNAIILLAKISIAKRNANTVLGNFWIIIQPFLHITVISFFMSFLLRYEPRIIVANLVGGLPFWNYILQVMVDSGESLKINAEILKRVLLPKTYFPISIALSHSYNLLLSFGGMYIAMIILYPDMFTWKVIFVPILALPLMICIITSSIAVAFLSAYLRDVPQLIGVLLGVIYWTVPIIYPYSLVPVSKQIFFEIHPIYIVIKPMQDLVINQAIPEMYVILKSWIVAFTVGISCYYIHKRIAKNVIFYL